MKPLISCVVAICNVEKYLDECITSLLEQNYSNIEIILVDDGSTDSSGNICDTFSEKDKRIRVIHQLNAGANCARNAGLAIATGKWVYFMDGDDYVNKDVFSFLEDYYGMMYDVLFFSNCIFVNGKIKNITYKYDKIEFTDKRDFYELSLATMDRYGDSKYNFKVIDAVSIWNKLYRKDFLIENKLTFVDGFPKTQDLSFNLLVYEKAKKGLFINHQGYVYRINNDSVSKRFQMDMPEKIELMIKWYKEYERKNHDERTYNALMGRILTFMRTGVVRYYCSSQNPEKYKKRKQDFLQFVNKFELNDISINLTLPIKEKILSYCIIRRRFWLCEILTKGLEMYGKK